MTKLLQFVVLIAAFYLLALVVLFVFQRNFLYVRGGTYQPPAAVGLDHIQELELATPDGERLLAWHHAPEPGEPTFLYLQGNADTMSDRVQAFSVITDGGYGLLAVSYRGYRGSTGRPTQDGLIIDAVTAYDWLAARGDTILIYGQSLGSGVATQLASRREAVALILEVPFTAAVDVAAWRFPFFPVTWLMKDHWASRDLIAAIDAPLLIVGAQHDEIIPVEQSRALFELASEPKTYVLLAESTHNRTWDFGMWEAVDGFLETVDTSASP